MVELDDESLVRYSLDDPARFAVIFNRHHKVIWRYVARLAGRHVADDLAGEVFVTAFAKRASFDPSRGEVNGWLFGIATNVLRSRLRSDLRARHAFWRATRQRMDVPDDTTMVDEALYEAGTMRAVAAAMCRLSRADRELLILYAWEGLTYQQIAAALDVPTGTVRSRLARTRQRLRYLVAQSGEHRIQPAARGTT